ncbi:MAG: DNA polymerase I [Ruminococcus sp.]|nr:DNA polymerase I [Ruminococcus sp.]
MKLLAIDGNSIMNRAFYGVKALSNKKGVFTNAITGFMNIYLKITGEISPDGVAAAFDLREPTFRHKANADYKANRHGMPDELAMQMPLIKDILRAMGVTVLECPGFEADDILGTLASLCGSEDSCYILTGDRDSLQLVTDNVTVLLHGTKELIRCTPEKFAEMYGGLSPRQIIDLKGLMGDSSDNISGVKGIGEKTAMTLIKQYSSVEELYDKLDKGEVTAAKSVITKLTEGADSAKESKWLATIVTNAPIDRDITAYKTTDRDNGKLSEILTDLEMTRLLEKLNVAPSAVKTEENVSLPEMKPIPYTVKQLSTADILKDGSPIAFIFSPADGLLPVTLYLSQGESLCKFTDEGDILAVLASKLDKVTFAAKPAYRYCLEHGAKLCNITGDADIAGYLLNASASEYKIPLLCAEYACPAYENMDEFADIAALSGLCQRLDSEITRLSMDMLYHEVELPLTEVLASMEHEGVQPDTDGIRAFGNGLIGEIEGLEQQIYFRAGHEFNISSPKQLGVVLFEEMGLPHGKKTKTKTGYSTGADVLEELRDKDPIIDMILTYRQYTKLQSTYVEGLLKTVSPDGRIHTVYKQTETRTGRISSTEPNLQNIPVRTELGRKMRQFFVSGKGKVFIDADYSQIELRILAHLSGDKNMREVFNSGGDIHATTAAQVFGLPPDMVTADMRRAAKAVNFGIVYGISPFSLSKDIDVTVAQAKDYINGYLANFSGVKEFMEKSVEDASDKGWSLTMFGRRRYIPELAAKNKNLRGFGERAAMNAPVQGTAADIIKIAMVKVYRRLEKELPSAKLILQIHDELIIEAPEADAPAAAKILGEEMRSAAQLSVPLAADVETGRSWYECH